MEEVFLSKSPQDTKKFAESLARSNLGRKEKGQGAQIILLYGNLGSGKTTFVQGFAKGLGITKRIISPTFVIVRQYEIADGKWFYHVDLYRLENEKEVEHIGLAELMENPKHIIVIEWPERLGSLLSKKRWELHFSVIGDNERKVQIMQFPVHNSQFSIK